MRKFISTITLFSLLVLTCGMQASAQDSTAEKLLAQAASLFQQKGAEVRFLIEEEGININGKLLMEGNKFHFDTNEMQVWFDGKTQWTAQHSSDITEVYISEPTPAEQQSVNPYLLLSHYKEAFSTHLGSKKGGVQEVLLRALNEKQELKLVNLNIKDNGELKQLTLTFPDERVYHVHILSFRNGLTFQKSTFSIPDAELKKANEVIDMR